MKTFSGTTSFCIKEKQKKIKELKRKSIEGHGLRSNTESSIEGAESFEEQDLYRDPFSLSTERER